MASPASSRTMPLREERPSLPRARETCFSTRALGQVEAGGDLGVGPPLGDQQRHLPLARAHGGEGIAVPRALRGDRGDPGPVAEPPQRP